MIFNLKEFRVNIPFLVSQLNKYSTKNPINVASEAGVYSHCPIIAMFHFLGELQGFTPELMERIARQMAVDGITKVIGVITLD